mmetsp:Transcript_27447/g.57879  ORF Transcript_27447/g.57879 Transcript_27447/m.57879 type:complete len:468 (+) Transcript_27447:29-1432(+)
MSLASRCALFIDSTPTPFHMCSEASKMLLDAGFEELQETDSWRSKLKQGHGYFYKRNGSTLVAFSVGEAFVAGNGFTIVGAHTDSPVLKLKPSSKKSAHDYLQLNVETYGGGLWHTWFDRELTLAGCVIVREKGASAFAKKLVHVKRALLRVPSLCIHLQSADERTSFAPNKETHLAPIIALVTKALEEPSADAAASEDTRHAPELLKLLAAELGCEVADIMDFELSLCDHQPAQIWGMNGEFLSSPRLDNQVHCFTSLTALVQHAKAADPGGASDVAMIALFDHEEVGSESYCGAGSTVMAEALQRVAMCFGSADVSESEALLLSTRKSFLISADVAHAIHPNWPSKHESSHAPKLNGGTVIKTNDNQRYATNSVSGFVVRELARRAGISVQEFMVKNDCPCGTTIGPIIAAKTGLRTVDVGVPSLSMHSIRETIGAADVDNSVALFASFFKNFRELDNSCSFCST